MRESQVAKSWRAKWEARVTRPTVSGESVNLASRLTDHARSGEVLLPSAIYRELRKRLDCEDVGDIEVKGLASPVRAWRPKGTRPPREGDRMFVGRVSELRQFAAAMAACLEVRRGRVIYVRGEAGLGKTRLIERLQRDARLNGFMCHSGLVLDVGAGTGRDAVRAVIRSIVQAGDAEPSECRARPYRCAGRRGYQNQSFADRDRGHALPRRAGSRPLQRR